MTRTRCGAEQGHEAKIREMAYCLWEESGRPNSRDVEFWECARALAAVEDNPESDRTPNPAAEGGADAATPAMEEAKLQENLGEFPSRLTDQGDRPQTPRRRGS